MIKEHKIKKIMQEYNLANREEIYLLPDSALHLFLTPTELKKVQEVKEVASYFLSCRNNKEAIVINSVKSAYEYLKPLFFAKETEEFYCMYLNRGNRPICVKQISRGGVSGTTVDIKLIVKNALMVNASSIILCHNHPSGNTKPSDADISLTKKIKDACKFFDIEVYDHIIIATDGYYSMTEYGINAII